MGTWAGLRQNKNNSKYCNIATYHYQGLCCVNWFTFMYMLTVHYNTKERYWAQREGDKEKENKLEKTVQEKFNLQ